MKSPTPAPQKNMSRRLCFVFAFKQSAFSNTPYSSIFSPSVTLQQRVQVQREAPRQQLQRLRVGGLPEDVHRPE